MRKLDHRHVVKLVATYAPRSHELCLLIWPAAVCNLSVLLDDVESLRLGEGDREDILERLNALDLKDLSAIEPSSTPQYLDSTTKCPLEFLRHVVGCTARAMAHCHANDVRHLDIKPSNILLNAGRVYLADFGISRDVSGQDHTTTEGLPGTERWRAPELYGDYGSSMQLSDIYSLGLVYLNIATVLYDARLTEFDDALRYPSRETREEQIRSREDKLKRHLEKLVAHSLVTPPFMFTYEGQETVRPRPLVNLIARMIAPLPQHRPAACKLDDKLSMLGGIHQIYHGECCKRPISWVEDKWDRKFTSIVELRAENARQLKRIEELEGKDKTYEQRLANSRSSVAELQAKLKEAEDRCRFLEAENAGLKKPGGRRASTLPKANRYANGVPTSTVGPPFTKTRSMPATPQTRPPLKPKSHSNQRYISPAAVSASALRPDSIPASPSPRTSAFDISTSSLTPQRSPSTTSLVGSRLPRRTGTPILNRDQSSTDSSKASSVFSRRSIETTPTPAHECSSPDHLSWEDKTERPPSPVTAVSSSRRTSTSEAPSSSAASSGGASGPMKVPSLVAMKSWADVARKEGRRVADRMK